MKKLRSPRSEDGEMWSELDETLSRPMMIEMEMRMKQEGDVDECTCIMLPLDFDSPRGMGWCLLMAPTTNGRRG